MNSGTFYFQITQDITIAVVLALLLGLEQRLCATKHWQLWHSNEVHDQHICNKQICPIPCQLTCCKQLCSNTDHLHGLKKGELHLCKWVTWFRSAMSVFHISARLKHSCSRLCNAQGICEIETVAQSIESTFTRQNKSFQYTKVSTFELCASSM